MYSITDRDRLCVGYVSALWYHPFSTIISRLMNSSTAGRTAKPGQPRTNKGGPNKGFPIRISCAVCTKSQHIFLLQLIILMITASGK